MNRNQIRAALKTVKGKSKPKANKPKSTERPFAVIRLPGKLPAKLLDPETVKVGRKEMSPTEFMQQLPTKGERRKVRKQLAAAGVPFNPTTYGMAV